MSNTMRELSAVELDQVSGGCDNCGDGGPGSCSCLPAVPAPSPPPYSCPVTYVGAHIPGVSGYIDCNGFPVDPLQN